MQTPLDKAVDTLGSQSALARAIGVSQPYVWNWINRSGGQVPAKYILAIENATKGAVSRHDLRPDLYPIASK